MQKKKKKNREPKRSSWGCRRRRRIGNPRDLAGDAEEDDPGSAVLEADALPLCKRAGPQVMGFDLQ